MTTVLTSDAELICQLERSLRSLGVQAKQIRVDAANDARLIIRSSCFHIVLNQATESVERCPVICAPQFHLVIEAAVEQFVSTLCSLASSCILFVCRGDWDFFDRVLVHFHEELLDLGTRYRLACKGIDNVLRRLDSR